MPGLLITNQDEQKGRSKTHHRHGSQPPEGLKIWSIAANPKLAQALEGGVRADLLNQVKTRVILRYKKSTLTPLLIQLILLSVYQNFANAIPQTVCA